MVAYFIPNLKKMVILNLFILCINPLLAQKNKVEINNDISLQIKIDFDTIYKGDSIVIEAIFTNMSKKSIEFFPRSIFLVKPFSAFGIDSALNIDIISNNLGYVVKIGVENSISQKYKIATNNSFFNIGINKVWLSYRFSFWLKQTKQLGNIKYVVDSQEINLFVKVLP